MLVQDNVNLCFLYMFESTFSLDVVHMVFCFSGLPVSEATDRSQV